MSSNDSDESKTISRLTPKTFTFPSFNSPARSAMENSILSFQREKHNLLRIIEQIDSDIADVYLCLSPIAQLPPEILSMIFILCVPLNFGFQLGFTHHSKEASIDSSIDSGSEDQNIASPRARRRVGNSSTPSRFQFNVLTVCRTWRRAAFATPQLWHRMDFNFPRAGYQYFGFERISPGWKRWLTRATAELSIEWFRWDRSPQYKGETPMSLFRQLVLTSNRWKCLSFNGKSEELSLLWKQRLSMTYLVSLSVQGGYLLDEPALECPRLEVLTTHDPSMLQLVKAPLLSQLDVTRPNAFDLRYISATFPLLKHLFIRQRTSRIRISVGLPIVFPRLECLEIIGDQPSGDCYIDALSTPLLSTLILESLDSLKIKFIVESLETLELCSGSLLSSDAIKLLLNSLPQLRCIRIFDEMFGDTTTGKKYLEVLMDESICPRLSHLSFSDSAIEAKSLNAFLELRAPSHAKSRNSAYQRRSAMNYPSCLVSLTNCTTGEHAEMLDIRLADYDKLMKSKAKSSPKQTARPLHRGHRRQ